MIDEIAQSPKPFLRWAGSKRKLVPYLKQYWKPDFSRYIEPFVGSGCLFFSINSPNSIISDINEDLILTYETIRDNPISLSDNLSEFEPNKDVYLNVRAKVPSELSKLERAANFIFLNRYCFNGLYRTNKKGIFNVPFGGHKSGSLPSKQHLISCSHALQSATIIKSDFHSVILDNVRENDFVYLDPPFAVQNKRTFIQYSASDFGLLDLERLRETLLHIDNCGAKFVLSYADSPEAYFYFESWDKIKVKTVRNISGFAKHRGIEFELFITNTDQGFTNA